MGILYQNDEYVVNHLDEKSESNDMSHTSFGLQDSPEIDPVNQTISEYIWLDELFDIEEPASMISGSMQNPVYPANEANAFGGSSNQPEVPNIRGSWHGQERKKVKEKVAFITKSDVEKLDDGFKWRKYGKKMVKNSPNPRNYYRCSADGCSVKKRAERDSEDPSYVITTYEGTHNHHAPFGY